ncbi:YG31B [Hepatospora eriocheir]|uniref:YG31B n=1 Tax=Hepatospora eriocheir TaxID=1081669 RepID=A0A1X0QDW6_9MICR|nr:YG31B [Hepatospora eriocheir]
MEKGYYQIKIDSNDTHKTAFALPNDLYEFTRIPFGLKNAPRVFQRVMQQILNVLDFVKVYLDDILIHSENIHDHIQHCKIILELLKNHNVKINFDKSKFIQYEVKYIGFIISNQGIKADMDKIDNIRNLHESQNVKQLQKFLGFVNWFRDFLPDLSKILIPLTDKLKNNSKSFEWTKKDEIICVKIFDLISK